MDGQSKKFILSVNGGSSSLKFSLFHARSLKLEWSGFVNHIATDEGKFEIKDKSNNVLEYRLTPFKNLAIAVKELIVWLKSTQHNYPIIAIGHRIVQGGPDHRVPEIITDELLKTFHEYVYLAPNHLPDEIQTIKTFQLAFPDIIQVACYDTSFHRDMPSYAKYYPLSAAYRDMGMIRYGFHGLSYEYIMKKLAKHTPLVNKQKIIIAHLGNGASMAAVKNGAGVDTTMGLSPTGGLVMATRPGDLDPGVPLFLLKQFKLTQSQMDEEFSKHSGLKAIAGISDVQQLVLAEANDIEAKEALTVFCYSAKKFIGALAAAMGGLDMLVFTGGIGENSAIIRERICSDMGFIGIGLNKKSNKHARKIISSKYSKTTVMVIKTNEERVIAHHSRNFIDNN